MTRIKAITYLVILISITSYCNTRIYTFHEERRDQTFSQLALIPGPIAKAASLEFSGIASDYLMLQTLTFLGEKVMIKEDLSKEQWQTIYKALKQVTYLDPRFLDPYVLAEMTLPWEANMVRETNELLEKIIKLRTNDHRPLFFLWYNYFYFLKDPATAAQYLKRAAKIQGAPYYYSNLAARSSFYGKQTEAGILFLREIIMETTDPTSKQFLLLRLQALEKISFLEQKIQEYKKKHNTLPETLEQLVEKGIIGQIPDDPYGGVFYIVDKEQVYSTSKLVLPPPGKSHKNK